MKKCCCANQVQQGTHEASVTDMQASTKALVELAWILIVRISIALATYNGAKYLSDQLESFCKQTRLPDELIARDDGSSDDTLAILEAFKKDAPFEVIVTRNSSNLGFIRNFERALAGCSGDLIFLSDQDDVWFDSKLETLERAARGNPRAMVLVHDAIITNSNLISSGASKLQQVLSIDRSDASFFTGALTALRRDFLGFALPFPEGISGHDVWLHRLAMALGARVVVVDKLQYLRRHETNTSSSLASSTEVLTRLEIARVLLSTNPASSYQDRSLLVAALGSRLEAVLEVEEGAAFSERLIKDSLDTLEEEISAIQERQLLLGRGLVGRRVAAVKMLLSGQYGHFRGFRSFIRDVTR